MSRDTMIVLGLAVVCVVVGLYLVQNEDVVREDPTSAAVWGSLPSVTGRVHGDGWQGTITIGGGRDIE